jgi:hypothetical protein
MIAREKPGDIKLPTNCSTITSFHLFEKELHLLLEFKALHKLIPIFGNQKEALEFFAPPVVKD